MDANIKICLTHNIITKKKRLPGGYRGIGDGWVTVVGEKL